MVNIVISLLNILIVLASLFLIGIILIQRGKGGGLAGAFGGAGGSSAFGTKAGDIFTKITIGVAVGWIVANMLLVVLTNSQNRSAYFDDTQVSKTKDLGASSTDTKSRSPAKDKDLKTDDLPPAGPSPSTGSPLPAPPVDIPAIPEIPASTPPPSSKPATTPAPAPAPAAPPSQSTPAPAPGKSAATPK